MASENLSAASLAAPEPPVTVIEPPKKWVAIDFGELWQYRELFGFLVWRDIKVMYKQTLLGVAWAVLVPFSQMVIFAFIFGRLAGLESNGLPGPLFYYAGLLPWTYFATSLGMSANSMVGNARLLTKVYFPRVIVPTSACVTPVVNFFIAFSILILMMFIYHVPPAAASLLILPLLVMAMATSLGAGLVLTSLNVKYRDIRYVVPFLVQVWMYLTVILPFSSFESLGAWRWLYGLNPMGSVVEGFRWCLFHSFEGFGVERQVEQMVDGVAQTVTVLDPVDPPWMLMAIGVPVAAALLAFGLYYFRRMERQFADIV